MLADLSKRFPFVRFAMTLYPYVYMVLVAYIDYLYTAYAPGGFYPRLTYVFIPMSEKKSKKKKSFFSSLAFHPMGELSICPSHVCSISHLSG